MTKEENNEFVSGDPYYHVHLAFRRAHSDEINATGRKVFYPRIHKFLLDPEFWKKLGEEEGWGSDVGNGNAWMKKMHQFVDYIIYGGSYNEFFAKILKK